MRAPGSHLPSISSWLVEWHGLWGRGSWRSRVYGPMGLGAGFCDPSVPLGAGFCDPCSLSSPFMRVRRLNLPSSVHHCPSPGTAGGFTTKPDLPGLVLPLVLPTLFTAYLHVSCMPGMDSPLKTNPERQRLSVFFQNEQIRQQRLSKDQGHMANEQVR